MNCGLGGYRCEYTLSERLAGGRLGGKLDMKVCPNCGHENTEGVIFCQACGVSLAGEHPISTRTLPESEQSQGVPRWGTARFKQGILIVHIKDASEPIELVPDDTIIIGRTDPASGTVPDLDLTPYNGVELGVSRIHAAIVRTDDGLVVEDLGSRNYTHLNGQRLAPHQPRVLRDGDELRLGRLIMRVYFK